MAKTRTESKARTGQRKITMTANKTGVSREAIQEWLDHLPPGIGKKLSSVELAALFMKMQDHKSAHYSRWIRKAVSILPAFSRPKTAGKQRKSPLVAYIQPRWATFTSWAGVRVGGTVKALFLGALRKGGWK